MDVDSDFHVPFHCPQLAPLHIAGWNYTSVRELVVSIPMFSPRLDLDLDYPSPLPSTICPSRCLLPTQVLPDIIPQEDAQALCDITTRLHNASRQSDVERCLRELALAWEDYYLPKFPVPFFQVRVADVRAVGGSLSTALELYDEVRGVVVCDAVISDLLLWSP